MSPAWKDHVKLPAVDGEQILAPSFIVNVPLAENVIILSLKQASAALLVTSVPLADALSRVHEDAVSNSVFVGAGVSSFLQLLAKITTKASANNEVVKRLFIRKDLEKQLGKVSRSFKTGKYLILLSKEESFLE